MGTAGSNDAQDPETLADLASQTLTPADAKLIGVFGDTIHRNDGRHLHGGIGAELDRLWQGRYDAVVANAHRLYSPPNGAIGKDVISQFAKELKAVRKRECNSERPLCFLAVVLARRPGLTKSAGIKRRVKNRLALWQEGKFDALVQDTTNLALARAGGTRRVASDESKARSFNTSVLDGNLRKAVRNLTGGECGGVFSPQDPCTKTGRPVI